MSDTLRALETALVDDPDDLAAHAAYADLLMERGDPRGEFIRVQLALEDPNLSQQERQQLRRREQELQGRHGRDWLGGLAPHLLDQQGVPERRRRTDRAWHFQFARGWLDSVHGWYLGVEAARAFARSLPPLRLFRRLTIEESAFEPPGEFTPGPDVPDDTSYPALYALGHGVTFPNLRVLQVGVRPEDVTHGAFDRTAWAEGVVDMIARLPRVEELYLFANEVPTERLFALPNLTRLHVLEIHHRAEYALEVLAANPGLGRLTHLLIHPGGFPYDDAPGFRVDQVRAVAQSPHLLNLSHLRVLLLGIGDAGCEVLATSGILKRLKTLDLRHGTVTDAGARALAACPDVANLELLDLSDNALTHDGIRALEAAGARLAAHHQHDAGDEEWRYQGDIE